MIILTSVMLISAIAAIILSLTWFGWKLLLILILWDYANNLSHSIQKIVNRNKK